MDRSEGTVPRPSVVRLTVTDFRCYTMQRLELDARPVVLTGANGAGKTNLLEAVSFLAPGRGLRGARLAAVGRRDPGVPEEVPGRPWGVAASVRTGLGTVDIGTGCEAVSPEGMRDRRVVRIDGNAARGQADLAEVVSVVWLVPAMDRLFVEGASARRRFLDRLVYGSDPAHAGRVAAYEHAMRERARLLRDGRGDAGWLAALEDTMATKGVAVAAARRDVTQRLAAWCAAAGEAFPRAEIAVRGTLEDWLADGPALAAEDRFRAALAESRRADAETGGAATGPHRSDLAVVHAAKGVAAAECSTGEQKALLISVMLANTRMLAAEKGATPILLLDEVAAHLDATRRAALFDELLALGAQAWLAGTDIEVFRPLEGRAQFLGVADANATPLNL